MKKTDKQKAAILRVLRDARGGAGSAEIARQLQGYGINLGARAIRIHLTQMEESGLVHPARRGRSGGRGITPEGLQEVNDAQVLDRVGVTATKMDTLACRMTLSLDPPAGQLVLNMTVIRTADLGAAMEEMGPVFNAGLGMGEHMAIFRPGETVGSFQIPEQSVGIGTVCSVTVNGVLLGARIPCVSRFAGVLEYQNGQPLRFTDVIFYEGTSLDPLEIFIKSGLTSVRAVARTGNGRIGASFREIPNCAIGEAEVLLRRMKAAGLGSQLLLGRPNQPLLGFPVQDGRTGLVVAGGLNPCAAFQETGIRAEHTALAQLHEFQALGHYHAYEEIIRNSRPGRLPVFDLCRVIG